MADKPSAFLEFEATFVADPAEATKLEGAINGIFSKVKFAAALQCVSQASAEVLLGCKAFAAL